MLFNTQHFQDSFTLVEIHKSKQTFLEFLKNTDSAFAINLLNT